MAATFYAIDPRMSSAYAIGIPEIPDWLNRTTVGHSFGNIESAVAFIENAGYNWDFESTWIVKDTTTKQAMLDMGFPRVLSADEIASGDYEFNNGAKIRVRGHNENGLSLEYVLPDGTVMPTVFVIPGSGFAAATFPSNVPGADPYGGQPVYYYYSIDLVTSYLIQNIRCMGSFLVSAFSPFWNGMTPVGEEDPYSSGGVSGTGGGTGDFDGTSDVIDFPPLPSLSATDTGFISLFNPSASQLKALADYMWSGLFDVDAWKKIFADPMDAILGLSIVPVNIPAGGSGAVTVGNISTGVVMTKAASQYVEVDCGTLNVNEFWGAYLDYDPYTKAEIYLPYVGTHPLAVDDIMGKAVHVKYHIDILSGACCAYVMCGTAILYSWAGQCSCSVPITGNDWTNVVNGAISIASSIGSMVATGGLSAPMAMASIASTAVNSMKPSVEKSGAMGSMGGMLGIQRPYLILTRPRQALPQSQNSFTGYPSFITMKLGDCAGYTEVEHIHIENTPATDTELSEIETLLKGGVII